MSDTQTYSIAEAAAATGLHRNTIRLKIKLGQLRAFVHEGKFGEEYRISHGALVQAGLLEGVEAPEEPAPDPYASTGGAVRPEARDEAGAPERAAPREADPHPPHAPGFPVEALTDLYQRHEQAMFRLGYLQGELERTRALAETAESLRERNAETREEMDALRRRLEEAERAAAEAELLRVEREKQASEVERMRQELERTRARLQEMEGLREDLAQLRSRHEQLVASLKEPAKKSGWWRLRS